MALQVDIDNKVLQLKQYVVNNAYNNIVKEDYADKPCNCLMNKIKLGIAYTNILECYEVDGEHNCLTEAEILLLIQRSTKLINSSC